MGILINSVISGKNGNKWYASNCQFQDCCRTFQSCLPHAYIKMFSGCVFRVASKIVSFGYHGLRAITFIKF